ncbi:MAG: hypothetical protein VX899_05855 [Myxococcota bacterium]|nr:hypothetical protein [Myxococcota bacterium]
MALKDRLSSLISGPAGHVVEAPVRELVQEALQQGNVASVQELQQLRRELGASGERIRALEARLDTLAEAVATLQAQADTFAAQAQEAQQALAQARAQLAKAAQSKAAEVKAAAPKAEAAPKAKAESAPKAAEPKAKAEPKADAKAKAAPKKESKASKRRGGRKSLKAMGCKVPGCKDPHRSKGFCSRHYQGWRRGRLEGFVGPEGYVVDGERGFRVDAKLQGQPVKVSGTGEKTSLKVGGEAVEFTVAD